jgi:hypothetical protein
MNAVECLIKLQAYFGEWGNAVVRAVVLDEIVRYDGEGIDRIFRELVSSRPAQWGPPDGAAIAVAVKRAREKGPLNWANGESVNSWRCPACENLLRGTRETCPECGYVRGDNVEEHKAWLKRFLEGKEERFDFGAMLVRICATKSIQRIDQAKKRVV